MSKRNQIKKVIISIIRFRILKRLSLKKLKTRVIAFLGSTMLIITILFTGNPAYADLENINANTNDQTITFVIRRDIEFENRIIRHTITENFVTDSIVGETFLIENGLRHTVEAKNSAKVKTGKLQSVRQRNNHKKFNQKVRTLIDLPKQRGDLIITKKLQSFLPYDRHINEEKGRQKLFNSNKELDKIQTEKLQSEERSKKYKKFNKKIHSLADLEKPHGVSSNSREPEPALPKPKTLEKRPKKYKKFNRKINTLSDLLKKS